MGLVKQVLVSQNIMNTDNNKLIVSICCLTYNHANSIIDTIEGFLMQKTTYRFEILIHDDASTDNTPKIIREYEKKYPELFICIYQQENQYSKGIKPSPTYVWPRAQGKYLAFCEGDDYWIDPYKLQKQIDFLESNPDYGMVHTDFQIRSNEKVYNRTLGTKSINSGFIFNDLLTSDYHIATLTVVVRKNLVSETLHKDPNIFKTAAMGDYPLWLGISSKYKIKYFPEITAIYRKTEGSLSNSNVYHQRVNFLNSSKIVQNYFAIKENASVFIIFKIKKKYLKELYSIQRTGHRVNCNVVIMLLLFSPLFLLKVNIIEYIKKRR